AAHLIDEGFFAGLPGWLGPREPELAREQGREPDHEDAVTHGPYLRARLRPLNLPLIVPCRRGRDNRRVRSQGSGVRSQGSGVRSQGSAKKPTGAASGLFSSLTPDS